MSKQIMLGFIKENSVYTQITQSGDMLYKNVNIISFIIFM